MNEGALAPGAGANVPAGGEPPRRSSGRQGLLDRLWRNERGTAIVEFALIAPVLFLLVFGIIDFARALNYYNQMSQLVGQGARAAAVNRNPDGTAIASSGTVASACDGSSQSIQCELVDYYAHSGEFQKGLAVCVVPPTGGTGSPLTVRARFDFHFLPLVGATLPLVTTQTERFEGITPDYGGGSWQLGGAGGSACP